MPDKFLNITLNNIDPAQMRAAVSDTLIEGGTVSHWWRSQRDSFVTGVMRQVREGVRNGTSNAEIARNLEAGTFARHRSQANALAATATNAVSNRARIDTFNENDDVIKGYQQISTLDNKTSDVCIAYSNMAWTLNGEPLTPETTLPFNGGPPRHFNCRSTLVPVLKSFAELGLPDLTLPEGTRASLDGQVPGDITFAQFLRSKPDSFADRMLGKQRAELWRSGKITLNQLVDMRGNPLTVEELVALSKARPKQAAKPPPAPAVATAPPAFEGVPEFKNAKEAEDWIRDNAVNREGPYATATNKVTGETVDVSVNLVRSWDKKGLRAMAAVQLMLKRRFGIRLPNYIGSRTKHPQFKFRGSRNALASVHMDSDSLLAAKGGLDTKTIEKQQPLLRKAVTGARGILRGQIIKKVFDDEVAPLNEPGSEALKKAYQKIIDDDEFLFTVGDNGTDLNPLAGVWRTFVHEGGHRIHAHHYKRIEAIFADIGRKQIRLWARVTSEYARENSKEFFAEQFVLYMLGGNNARIHPQLLRFFKELDRGGEFGVPEEMAR